MTMNPEIITYFTLSCGMRCVHRLMPGNPVEYTGVAIDVGSRHDKPGYEGLAHFVEHTIFKGTGRRKSWHIINRMESCGGEPNAYTTKETTMVYSLFPVGNLSRAIDLIADLVTDSKFPTAELDKEREVVADEISSYLDMPSEAVFDDFEDMLFAGTPLGHNILGSAESLNRFDSEVCRRYLARNYTAGNMVLFYCGPVSAAQVRRIADRSFSTLARGEVRKPRLTLYHADTFRITRPLGIHQAHTVMGAMTPGMYDSDRYALSLLVNILGGPGMNSLLNMALRERRGLVYSVEASASLLTDVGVFTVYFGCDSEDVTRCCRLVDRTISSLIDGKITQRTLDMAKRQYLGQLTVASDNLENYALSMGRAVLYRGRMSSPDDVRRMVEAITVGDLRRVASSISPDSLSRLTFV